ncbi:hypothetical protein [Sulfitobacter sp.]|jgi:hypothetical protein|uniref:hypothetical protein n=1 Tax=Sulfitobacter sp. TaxID=1903071 RepID=UPI0030010219
MPNDYRFYLYVVLAGGAAIYGVSLAPPLTTGGNAGMTGISQTKFDETVSQELTYCLEQANEIDCRCFANLSGVILAHNEPRVPGAVYADKQELARGQATGTC